MKTLLSIILCLCFAFSGCTRDVTAPRAGEGGVTPEPSPAPLPEAIAAESFEPLALALAALPELPEEPDESALWEQLDGKSAEEQTKLWDEFCEKQAAYDEAVEALRGGASVDPAPAKAFTDYALRTARQLTAGQTEENVVYSPANLYLALCMLAETTDGESRAQLLELLGLESAEQARAAANALFRSLYSDGADGKTLLANSIWLSDKLTFKQETVDALANDCFASSFRAPMGESATDAAIHEWINENTNHLLEDAANGLKTTPDTLMLLLSTLYFKGTWADQFAEGMTREDTFTAASGAEERIDFMHTAKDGAYFRGERYTVASLPFRGGTSMWFLLPDEGAAPSAEALLQAAAAMRSGTDQRVGSIHWSVPKFDVDSDLDLIPALEALGVTDVFTDAADFSPLTDEDALVSAVKHAARVKVDEEGCEAAAFIAIMAECTAALIEPLPVVEMDLNRPFAFLITGADGTALFTGLVNTVR